MGAFRNMSFGEFLFWCALILFVVGTVLAVAITAPGMLFATGHWVFGIGLVVCECLVTGIAAIMFYTANS